MRKIVFLPAMLLAVLLSSATASAAEPAGSGATGLLRAYVTGFDSGTVSAIDVESGQVVKEIATGTKPHGVAIAPDGRAVYVSNEGDGTVSIIDPIRNEVIGTIKVGKAPHQLAVGPDGKRVFVAVNGEGMLAVLDPVARSVVKSIPVGRNPHIVEFAPDGKTLYVTSEGDGKISIVDTARLEVTGEIPVFGFPRVLAVHPDGSRIYLTMRWVAGVLVIDPTAKKILDRWVLAPSKFDSEGKESHGPGITPDGSQLWLTVQTTNEVVVADPSNGRVIDRFPVGRNPNWVGFSPDGKTAVVSNTSSDDVSIIDVAQRKVMATVKVGKSPKRLAVGLVAAEDVAPGTSGTTGNSVENFDTTPGGSLPKGWVAGVTGSGNPKWAVTPDLTAPSSPNVLAQTGVGTYPHCVNSAVSLTDGFVEVRFKPVSGNEDQAGGLIWRFKDKDNYYIARANALEDNVTIYHTLKGSRQSFKNVDMKVSPNSWHKLRVEFKGTHFRVFLDGLKAIEADDTSIAGPGSVGVWTKADIRTFHCDVRASSNRKANIGLGQGGRVVDTISHHPDLFPRSLQLLHLLRLLRGQNVRQHAVVRVALHQHDSRTYFDDFGYGTLGE